MSGDPGSVESFPSEGEVEGRAVLRDGRSVDVRRLQDRDTDLLREFLKQLADASIAARFFALVPRSTALVELLKGIGSPEHFAMVMVSSDEGRERIVAHAEYVRDATHAPAAEVAFLTADAYRGQGCATILLFRLAHAARKTGIRAFHASVLMENALMLEVFRGSGFPVEEWWGADGVQVTFPIAERFEHPPGGTPGPEVPA